MSAEVGIEQQTQAHTSASGGHPTAGMGTASIHMQVQLQGDIPAGCGKLTTFIFHVLETNRGPADRVQHIEKHLMFNAHQD